MLVSWTISTQDVYMEERNLEILDCSETGLSAFSPFVFYTAPIKYALIVDQRQKVKQICGKHTAKPTQTDPTYALRYTGQR